VRHHRCVRRSFRHVPALAGFAAFTIVWLWSAVRQPMDVIPGAGAGDNLTFVWNTWWMHQAVAAGQSPLWTSMLFAPWGTGLAAARTRFPARDTEPCDGATRPDRVRSRHSAAAFGRC
jgi:hypothetical protein